MSKAPVTVDFNHSIGKGLRRLLWEIVTDATLNQSVRIFARELLRVSTGIRVRCIVGITFKRDGGAVITGPAACAFPDRGYKRGSAQTLPPSIVKILP